MNLLIFSMQATNFFLFVTLQEQYFIPLLCCLQIDLNAEEMNNNIPAEVMLLGDLKTVTEQVCRKYI